MLNYLFIFYTESFSWEQVSKDPQEVVEASTVLLTWRFRLGQDEKWSRIAVVSIDAGEDETSIGSIQSGKITVSDPPRMKLTVSNGSLTLTINEVNTTDEAAYWCRITIKSKIKKNCINLKVLGMVNPFGFR